MSGNCRVVGAVVQGASHLRQQTPCQDAFALQRLAQDPAVVAVAIADGHGSSRFAREGASLAVETCTRELLFFYERLPTESRANLRAALALAEFPARRLLVQSWVEAIEQLAGHQVEPTLLREYGSTLLWVLSTPNFLLIGQLGDGDVLVCTERGVSRPYLNEPRFGEETASLCQPEAWLQMQLHIQPAPHEETLVLLSTDGYSNSYTTGSDFERIGPDYLALLREHGAEAVQEKLPDFLQKVSTDGSGDDVSLAMLYFSKKRGV
jgi:hypothetical protein